MPTGVVKWFSNLKGYGFASMDGEQRGNIFLHFSAIEMEGYKKLAPGQRIEFEVDVCPQGLQARKIRLIQN